MQQKFKLEVIFILLPDFWCDYNRIIRLRISRHYAGCNYMVPGTPLECRECTPRTLCMTWKPASCI